MAADANQRLAIDELATERLAEIDSGLASEVTEAQQILTGLRALEHDVQATAETIGDRVLTGDYGMYAAAERRSANQIRYAAIAFLAAAAGFAVWAAFAVSKGEITWQRLVAKLGVTVVPSGVASYLASQSREHREQERQARRRRSDRSSSTYLPNADRIFVASLLSRHSWSRRPRWPTQSFRGEESRSSSSRLLPMYSPPCGSCSRPTARSFRRSPGRIVLVGTALLPQQRRGPGAWFEGSCQRSPYVDVYRPEVIAEAVFLP
jgi:hypothetical protein